MNKMARIPVPDFDKYCRLCATKTTSRHRINIFQSDSNHLDLHMKISKCLPVVVTEFDFLPQSVCTNCANKVSAYFEFREVTVTSESFLYDLYVKHSNAGNHQTNKTIGTAGQASNTHPRGKQPSDIVSCVIEDNVSDNEHYQLANFESEPFSSSVKPVKVEKQKNVSVKAKSLLKTSLSPGISLLKPFIKKNDEDASGALMNDDLKSFGNSAITDDMRDSCNLPPTSLSHKVESLSRSLLKLTSSESTDGKKVSDLRNSTESIKTLYQCPQCSLFFMPMAAAHHDCKQTRKKGRKKGRPKMPKVHHEPKSFTCTDCGKVFPHKGRLIVHMRRHTGERPFACTQCDKAYSSQSSLYLHKEQVHEKNWKYVCSYCGRGFICRNRYECHVRKDHTGERPFQCSYCEKSYHRKQALQEHEEANHPSTPQQYTCETCGKTFRCLKHLKVHERIHKATLEERKKFKCTICNSSHTTNRSLNHHMLSHTGELPFECEKCNKRFRGKDGLRIHLLIHAGIKQFVCDICGKGFALKNTLDCHMRTHTGEHPYECDICNKCFTQKSSLNCHRKRHVRHQELGNQIT